MVAISHPTTRPTALQAPASAAVYRRRRLVAAGLAVLLLVSLLNLASFLVGRLDGTADPAAEPSPVAEVSVVVEPGDTVWSIAASLVDGDDVRPVVDALIAANGGAVLEVGERLVITVP
jgi:hypothetical protein